MSINKAQLVFNNNTFTRKHIFSFLQISAKQRVDMIKQNKCQKQIDNKKRVVSRIAFINLYDISAYDDDDYDISSFEIYDSDEDSDYWW